MKDDILTVHKHSPAKEALSPSSAWTSTLIQIEDWDSFIVSFWMPRAVHIPLCTNTLTWGTFNLEDRHLFPLLKMETPIIQSLRIIFKDIPGLVQWPGLHKSSLCPGTIWCGRKMWIAVWDIFSHLLKKLKISSQFRNKATMWMTCLVKCVWGPESWILLFVSV